MQSPVLVGRAEETSALRAAVTRAEHGRGGAVFLVGEPGIGKSRLASETAGHASRRGLRVLKGRASRAVPLRALCEAVLSAFRRGGAPDETQLGAYLPVLLRMTPDAPAGVPDPAVVRAEAVLRLLTAEKTVLLLEDLHEADDETLAVVDYLLDNLADAPVLLLATTRPHPEGAQRLVDAATARRTATTLRLTGLGAAEVAELARHCLGEPVPDDVVRQLVAVSDGVPFVVEELLDGDLRAVPPTVAAATLQRVDALGPGSRAVLEAAALFGRTFPLDVVAAVVDSADVSEAVLEAERAQLLHGHQFRHALTADAITGRMTPTARAALARRAAEAAEALRPGEPELVAELWEAGGETAKAVRCLVRAGRHAGALGRFGIAVELLERGQALTDEPDLAADLLDALAAVLPLAAVVVPADNGARAFALGERLQQSLTESHAEPRRRGAVRLAQARVAAVAGQWERGLDLLETAGETSPAVDVVKAALLLGLNQLDLLPKARALAERAAATGTPEIVCEALEVLTRCTRGQDLAEARQHVQRWLRTAEQHGLAAWRLRALLELGITDKYLTTGVGTLLAARQAALDTGAIVILIAADLHLGATYLVRGEYEKSAWHGASAGEAAGKLGLHALGGLAVAIEAGIAAVHGDRRATDRALARLRDHGESEEIWSYSSAVCALMEERYDRALAEFDEVEKAVVEPRILRGTFYQGPRLLVRVALGLAGRPEFDRLAESHLSQVQLHRTYFAWSRAILLGREGRTAEANAAAAEALDLSKGLGLPRYLGLRLAGPRALADGWGEPLEWLGEAEEYFHQLGVPAVAAACRAVLREAGAPKQRRRRDHETVPAALRKAGVTVREYEVLCLVVERFGNAEIAERLFLSPRTVERHVASLKARTGRRTRADLISHARPSIGGSTPM
ncbi:ATP-binding protein [Lentzea albida]|uniref:Regulatory protein, luxR family n=1 Tax=Lentzea albida TaxID=65499 RepID=A0A1H9TNG5_9PSEU|nr:LuxR family transcriptional regulator [Lentzea albida]SER98544.1 regulatory protein, luxR family [Lentzea albida]